MNIFVEIFSLTVVTKNFALDATGLVDLRDRLSTRLCTLFQKQPPQVFSCEFYEMFKGTFFTEHLWTTASTVSAAQSNKITLEQRFVESCFDVIVLTLRRRNTEGL